MSHVAFFLSDYPVLSETFVVRQIQGVLNNGHAVTVICGNYTADISDPLLHRVSIRVLRKPIRPAQFLGAYARNGRFRNALSRAISIAMSGYRAPLADLIGSSGTFLGDYDAIVAHFGPGGVRASYLRDAGLLCGPLATIFHGIDITQHKLLSKFTPHYRQLFAKAEILLPISNLWRERLIDLGASAERTVVLHMGADVSEEPPEEKSDRVNLPLRVLSVGRLVEKKGLADAICGVNTATVAIDYRIIGDGPLGEDLRCLAAQTNGQVTFLGKQPQWRVFNELARADVFLLPSVTGSDGDMEGIPVSLMEAMARGVVVVATRHSGIPELIEDGVTGLLVDERSSTQIANALERIASGVIDLSTMRIAAHRTIRDRFNNESLDEDMNNIISCIINCA